MLLGLCLLVLMPAAHAGEPTDAEQGRALYAFRCEACHAVDANRVGPMHRGVVGRKAGSAPGYAYSEALQRSQLIWTPETLNAWLSDPEALIPGQRMDVSVSSADVRRQIVAYLATLTGPPR